MSITNVSHYVSLFTMRAIVMRDMGVVTGKDMRDRFPMAFFFLGKMDFHD
jgi:hypothetical protein